eukprot:7156869-Prymnesium_polylepis.1
MDREEDGWRGEGDDGVAYRQRETQQQRKQARSVDVVKKRRLVALAHAWPHAYRLPGSGRGLEWRERWTLRIGDCDTLIIVCCGPLASISCGLRSAEIVQSDRDEFAVWECSPPAVTTDTGHARVRGVAWPGHIVIEHHPHW